MLQNISQKFLNETFELGVINKKKVKVYGNVITATK